MTTNGQLIVFEGPDGVGKSTLANWLVEHLKDAGIQSVYASFPGREDGSLGQLVYKLHHSPEQLGIVSDIVPASMQLMHMAAHLTVIKMKLLPMLSEGKWIVLDRFWWSTWVYGTINGIDSELMRQMLSVEHRFWGEVVPNIAFLVKRRTSLKADGPATKHQILSEAYITIANEQSWFHPVDIVDNNGEIDIAKQYILLKIKNLVTLKLKN